MQIISDSEANSLHRNLDSVRKQKLELEGYLFKLIMEKVTQKHIECQDLPYQNKVYLTRMKEIEEKKNSLLEVSKKTKGDYNPTLQSLRKKYQNKENLGCCQGRINEQSLQKIKNTYAVLLHNRIEEKKIINGSIKTSEKKRKIEEEDKTIVGRNEEKQLDKEKIKLEDNSLADEKIIEEIDIVKEIDQSKEKNEAEKTNEEKIDNEEKDLHVKDSKVNGKPEESKGIHEGENKEQDKNEEQLADIDEEKKKKDGNKGNEVKIVEKIEGIVKKKEKVDEKPKMEEKNEIEQEKIQEKIAESGQNHKIEEENIPEKIAESDQNHKIEQENIPEKIAESGQKLKIEQENIQEKIAKSDQNHKIKQENIQEKIEKSGQNHKIDKENIQEKIEEESKNQTTDTVVQFPIRQKSIINLQPVKQEPRKVRLSNGRIVDENLAKKIAVLEPHLLLEERNVENVVNRLEKNEEKVERSDIAATLKSGGSFSAAGEKVKIIAKVEVNSQTNEKSPQNCSENTQNSHKTEVSEIKLDQPKKVEPSQMVKTASGSTPSIVRIKKLCKPVSVKLFNTVLMLEALLAPSQAKTESKSPTNLPFPTVSFVNEETNSMKNEQNQLNTPKKEPKTEENDHNLSKSPSPSPTSKKSPFHKKVVTASGKVISISLAKRVNMLERLFGGSTPIEKDTQATTLEHSNLDRPSLLRKKQSKKTTEQPFSFDLA